MKKADSRQKGRTKGEKTPIRIMVILDVKRKRLDAKNIRDKMGD